MDGRQDDRFSFGKNWKEFIERKFSPERLEMARKHLSDFLERSDLQGLSFLDIGCGSGLHSLAALELGASSVFAFDIDPDSVATTRYLLERYGKGNWEVKQGSVLDAGFVSMIKKADVVYAWGVLHHTGDLWTAVKNAASLVKDGGLFYVAIYERERNHEEIVSLKKRYNEASCWGKRMEEIRFLRKHFFPGLSLRRWFISLRHIVTYQKRRGMAFMTDVRDWLGGWPYEPASEEEVVSFCEKECNLKKCKVKTGEANIEYLFQKIG